MIFLIPLFIITSYLFGLEYFMILCATTLFGGIYEHFSYYMASYLDGKIKHRPFGAPTKKIIDNPIMTGAPLYTIGFYIVICAHYFVRVYVDNLLFNFMFYGGMLTLFEYIAGRILGAGSTARDGKIMKGVWDYSDEPCNLQGIVSLRHFIIWSVCSLLSISAYPIIVNFVRIHNT